jgi:tagatose 6-phosphate kinase
MLHSVTKPYQEELAEGLPSKLVIPKRLVAVSNTGPKGSPEAGYSEMIKKANKSSVPSFLDCTGIQLQNAVKYNPYCIHLNRHEVTTFTGNNNFGSALNEISKDCQLAAITDGANGLSYFNGSVILHSLAKITKVHSSIGSGDCLLAGIIAGHIYKKKDQDIANLGAACGAANCLRQELGMMRRSDVEELLLKL